MQTRRKFLKESAIVSMTSTIPVFLESSCYAYPRSQASERILVVVQLDGGNDGLNTVVPFQDEVYLASRKELRIPKDSLIKINENLALHPSMRGMARLFDKGKIAIVQGVGYPDPNRSHDVSMNVWHTARMGKASHLDGWLGRSLGQSSSGQRVPVAVATVNDEVPLALRGKSRVSTVISLDEFRSASLTAPIHAVDSSPETSASGSLAGFMRQTALETQLTVEQIRSLARTNTAGVHSALAKLTSPIAKQLSVIFDLIQADFGATVYFASQPGYDTHFNQIGIQGTLLESLSDSLAAFMDDLDACGHADRVLVMCFSEFGRQVTENATLGTDHGTAGPMFLLGNKIKPGIFGTQLDLSRLVDDAPHHTVDFRDVYAGVLNRWLGIDPTTVLDGYEGELVLC